MTSSEFVRYRQKLGKTQKETSQLLGISLKAVTSYEQGWRKIPPHVERQIFFLLARKFKAKMPQDPCWICKNCPPERKKACPSWEFQVGHMCWFICGTKCEGCAQDTWEKKMKICGTCDFFRDFLKMVDSADPNQTVLPV